jgi:lipopolysaccharide export system permease protein
MRSSGLSIFQVTRVIIIFGMIVSLFVFWINDRFVPSSLSLTQKIKDQIESGTKKAQEKENEILTNISMYGLKNRLFFVNKFSLATSTMEGITILEHDEHQNITKKIVANKGVYKDGLWRFYKCITYNFDIDGQVKQEPQYLEEEIVAIPETPREFLNQRQRPDSMTIVQLDEYIWKLSKSGATTVIRNLQVDLYQKFTAPLTSIIIIMLGIPFSMRIKKRAAGLSSLGFAIMIGFLYYFLNAMGIALGKTGILAPIIAVSLSHIAVLAMSLYLILTSP